MTLVARHSLVVKSGLKRAMIWLITFAAFTVVECVVPSSANAMISGVILIACFAALDLARWREKQRTTLHGLALASAVVSYATALALVVAIFDFNSSRSVATSFSEFGRALERAVSMYVGHCLAFGMFTAISIAAAIRYRLSSGSGLPVIAFSVPCALLAASLGVYHLLFGI